MRLIDADELLKFLIDVPSDINEELTCTTDVLAGCAFRNNEILSFINEMPTIDTERHGLWKIEQENIVVPMYCFTCSVCGEMFCDEDKYIVASMHYCMNCGAKMNEVVE